MKWYNGFNVKIKKEKVNGYTLLDALDNVIYVPKRNIKNPFRMPVSSIEKISGIGDVICGRIEQGKIKVPCNVKFYPTNIKGKALSIQMHKKSMDVGLCGHNVGINVRGLNKNYLPKIGDIMCIDNINYDKYPPKECIFFKAMIYVESQNEKIKCSNKIINKSGNITYKGGYTPLIHCRTAKVPCQLIDIEWKIVHNNGIKILNKNELNYVKYGDQALVTFKPLKAFCVTTFDECKPFGRIAGMNSNSLALLGKVVEVTHKNSNL